MPNAIVTRVCTRKCSYCFAAPMMARNADRFMDRQTWEAFLDFLDRSGIEEARMVGGEPTLHPCFSELVRAAVARNKRVVVFSNGMMPRPALDTLVALPEASARVILNCHEPVDRQEAELDRQIEVIRALPDRVILGYNIHRLPFDLCFLLELYEDLPLHRRLRLGLAQPSLLADNRHLLPHQYPIAGARIAAFAEEASSLNVEIELDCGFVRCMFDDEAMDALEKCSATMRFRCSPILDVSDALEMIHCFALGDMGAMPLTSSVSLESAAEAFGTVLAPYRAGIYPDCTQCPFWESRSENGHGGCSGGCLAHVVKRFQHVPFSFEIE